MVKQRSSIVLSCKCGQISILTKAGNSISCIEDNKDYRDCEIYPPSEFDDSDAQSPGTIAGVLWGKSEGQDPDQ